MNVLKGILLGFLLGSSTMVLAVVDINKANIEELKQLKGIGEKKAADIIAYRKTHGAFKSVDELINVKGVGKATLEQNRNELSVSAGDENQEERLEESATKNQKNERDKIKDTEDKKSVEDKNVNNKKEASHEVGDKKQGNDVK